MKNSYTKLLAMLLCGSLLMTTGCAMEQYKRDVDNSVQDNEQITKQHTQEVQPSDLAQQNALIINSNTVWLGSNVIPMQQNRYLPKVFDHEVTFIFPDKANLSTIAQRVTKVTGVLVRIMPDVFITASSLNQSGGGSTPDNDQDNAQQGGVDVMGGLDIPFNTPALGGGLTGMTTSQDGYDLRMALNYSGPLAKLLDLVAARAGISWEYKNEAIYFYRFETKTFTLKALPGSIDMTTKIGKDTSSSSGVEGGSGGENSTGGTYSSSASAGTNIKLSIWDSIVDSINVMLTPLGKVSVSQATGTITVRDTPEVISQVGALINNENRVATKQINIKVQVFSITQSDSNQFGIDWDVVFTRLSQKVGKSWDMVYGSPPSLLSSQTANLGYTVLTSGTNPERFEGSSLLFRALGEVGNASVVTTTSITTTNNQPVPFALTNQTGYLANTTAVAGSLTGAGTPGLSAGMVTTGYVMNILPTVLDNGKILMQLGINISQLDRLNTVSSGDQSIQTPEISSNEIFQRISLRPNETLVLNAFSRVSGQYDKRGITQDANIGLGGSFDGRKQRTTLVVLLTPTLLEGS
jgi:type IVB pilus formation R64 PilN family outer membrane protein